MQAEIISIGTELTLGQIVNTNAAYICRKLAELGIEVAYETMVADNPERLSAALRLALNRSDITITVGGLGPTVDDITTAIIAEVTEKPLVYDKIIASLIKSHYQRRNIKFPKDAARQAYIPDGAGWLKNDVGTAPGLIIEQGSKVLFALPGPPHELKPMFEEGVARYLREKFTQGWTIKSRTIRTAGLVEAEVHPKIKGILKLTGDVTVGIYARPGLVDLRINAKGKNNLAAEKLITPLERKIRARLGKYIYGVDNETLEEAVGGLLLKKKKTLSIAESCTGGLIANRITDISGSSKYFKMAVVAYSNETKISLLGLSRELIKKYGAVSSQAALALAGAVRQKAGADIGLGITGIAGPTGATKDKPIGLLYIAISTAKKTTVKKFNFTGERQHIKSRAASAALNLLRLHLQK